MNQQQATPGDSVPVPQVVESYAGYLRAKAHVMPNTVDGGQAVVNVSIGESALVLIFRCRGEQEWSLRGAEVRRGEQATAFARGDLADVVATLLGHEPASSCFRSRKG